jgi:flagellar biosynthesis protein FlhF
MDLRTFQAATMSEALAQVKTSLGPTAVILHTRTFRRARWLGLRRQNIVEVTAGRGLNVGDRSPRRQPPRNNRISAASPAVINGSPSLARTPAEAGRQLLQSPAAQSAVLLGMTQEINGLKSMLKDLVVETRSRNCPNVPEELFEYYSHLIQNQVATELAADLIKQLGRQIRPEHARQPEYIREKLAEHIERMLPSAGPIIRTKTTGPHVVALIGPTGVGKTTTIAKLAANLKYRERRRVGLITIDTFRIAAIEQLKRYADIIGSPLAVTGSPEELKAALRTMQDYDYVLIDTTGRSPNDALKLNELKQFLAAANPDEVHLVLSTTASQSCVELAISRFSDIRADKIIFTKLDEAAHLGVVLNVVQKVNKSLSYVTTGQDVPDDIEVGRGRKLAQMILGVQP